MSNLGGGSDMQEATMTKAGTPYTMTLFMSLILWVCLIGVALAAV